MAQDKKKKTNKTNAKISRFLGGEAFIDFCMKYYGLILFIIALIIIRMVNGYQAEKVLVEIGTLRTTNKKLKFESLIIESELMKLGRPSIVRKKVEASGLSLKEPQEAPGVIYVEEID